jgi:hypothetical protein
MDEIIDNAIFRAGGLPIASLRSLPCDLGRLGIRRFGGLAGEIACLRGRTVFYEFAEKYTPRLLEGFNLDFWPPIVLGAAENRVWTEVAGLFRPESSPLCDFINLDYSAADRKAWRTGIRGAEANIKSEGQKLTLVGGSTPPFVRTPLRSLLAAEQPLPTIRLLVCRTGRFLSQLSFPFLGRIEDLSPHTPVKITCVVGRRRCRYNKRVDLNSEIPYTFTIVGVAKDSSFAGTTTSGMPSTTCLAPRYATTLPTTFRLR